MAPSVTGFDCISLNETTDIPIPFMGESQGASGVITLIGLRTFIQLLALGSNSSIVVICSRNEVSRNPGLISGSNRASGLSTSSFFKLTANADISIGNVLNGFQLV